MATRYLLGKGHRRIAFISGSIRENGVNIKRYQGYCDALKEAGLTVDESAVYSGTVDDEYGLAAARQYLERGKRQTAAFITADVISMGFIKGLRQQGICVPDDISIVSFDDVYLANMAVPSLTTVHQDIEKKGRKAVELVLEAANAKERRHMECILPLQLIERDSVREWREPR